MSKRVLSMLLAVLLLASVWTPAFAEEGPEEPAPTEEAAPAETTEETPAEPEDTDEPEAAPTEAPAEAEPTEEPAEEPVEPEATEEPEAVEDPTEEEPLQEETLPIDEPMPAAEGVTVTYVMPNGENKSAAASKVKDTYEYEPMPDSVDGYWLDVHLNMQYTIASVKGATLMGGSRGLDLDRLTGETGHSYEIMLDDDVSAVTVTLKKEAPTDLEDTKVIPITYVDPLNKITNKNNRESGFAYYIESWDSFDVDLSDKNYTLKAEGAYINSAVEEEDGTFGYYLTAEPGAESITVTVVESKELELDTSRSVYKNFTIYADAACTQPFSGKAKTGTVVYIPADHDVYYVEEYASDCNVFTLDDDGHHAWKIYVMDRNGDGKCSFSVLPLPVLEIKGAASKVTFTYYDYLENGSTVKRQLKTGDKLPFAEKGVEIKLEKGYTVRGDVGYIPGNDALLYDDYTVDDHGNIVNDQPDGKCTVYVYQPKKTTVNFSDPDGVFNVYKLEPNAISLVSIKSGASVPEGTTIYFVYKNKANKGAYRLRADGVTVEEGLVPSLPDSSSGIALGTAPCWSAQVPTATESGWKSSYTITVEPTSYVAAPADVKAENVTGGVKVSWAAVAGAEKYQVYYRASTKDAWKAVGEAQTGTAYTVTGLTGNKTYYFAVRCVTAAGGNASALSASVTRKYIASPGAPMVALADSGIKISWKKASGASKYQVYYKQEGAGEWTAVLSKPTTGTSTTWSGYTPNMPLVFAVQSMDKNGAALNEPGPASASVRIVAAPAAKAENAANGVKISWPSVAGVVKYQVYYRTSTKKSWKKLGDAQTGLEYTYTSAASGKTYYFTVRCVTDTGAAASPYSASMKQKYIAAPKAPTAALADSGIKISWKKVSGASYYQVYEIKGGSQEPIGSPTKSTSYTWKDAAPNEAHVFAVQCTNKDGATANSVIGASSEPITIVGAPEVVTVDNTNAGVVISWDKVDGAVKYQVYYRTSTKKSWSKLGEAQDAAVTSYPWAKAKKGTTYYFAVRCVTDTGAAASPYSASVTRKYLATPAAPTAALADSGIKISWKKVTGASKYQLYYEDGTGAWKELGDPTKSTSYTWKEGYTSQTTYTFAVEALSGDHVSAQSAASGSFTAVAAPQGVTAENTVDGVKISWKPVEGAEMYRVYYATKKSGSLKKVADVPAGGETSYTWEKAKKGSTYYYAVRCVTADGAAASPYSARVARKYVAAPTVKAAIVSTGIKLSWSKCTGASKYQVYYKEGAGEWTKLTLTKSTSYTWKAATPGVEYTFTAEATDSKGNVLSAKKEDGAALTMAAKPELTFAMTEGGLKISWAKDSAAAKYQVYYGTKKSSLKKLGGPVTDGTCTLSSAKKGKTYYFSVRPLTESGALAGPYETKGYTVPKA